MKGVCAGLHPRIQDYMWGPDRLNDPARQRALTAAAQVLCDMCPIRSACLADAIGADDQYGVFGGLTVKGRRTLARFAQTEGVVSDGGELSRSRFVTWLDMHPEAIDQARIVQTERRRGERGDRRSRAVEALDGRARTVAFLSALSGAGKTVSVVCTAWALASDGAPVRVVDIAPDGHLCTWATQAARSGRTLPFDVVDAAAFEESGAGHDGGWTLLDAPHGASRGTRRALECASLAILVSRTDEESLKATWQMSHHLAVASSVLIADAADRREGERAQAWLDEHRLAHTVAAIGHDDGLAALPAPGERPPAGTGYGTLANELRDVFRTR